MQHAESVSLYSPGLSVPELIIAVVCLACIINAVNFFSPAVLFVYTVRLKYMS